MRMGRETVLGIPGPDETADGDERRLVALAANGDAAAFDALMRRHRGKVASVAARFLADPNDVEDAVQETFVQAFRSLRGFHGGCSVRTWLVRIAINVCKMRLRAAWWHRVTLVGGAPIEPETGRDARAEAEAGLRREELQRALGALPDKLRVPVVLHFLEGFSGAEIAAALNCNASTVWSRIYAGLRKLRETLGPDFEPDGR